MTVNADKGLSFERLVRHKPMLLLNLSRYSVCFVGAIARRSPWLIASQEGRKTLPLELWYMILDAARENTEFDHASCSRATLTGTPK